MVGKEDMDHQISSSRSAQIYAAWQAREDLFDRYGWAMPEMDVKTIASMDPKKLRVIANFFSYFDLASDIRHVLVVAQGDGYDVSAALALFPPPPEPTSEDVPWGR